MPDRVHAPPDLIFSPGTQVVCLVDVVEGGMVSRGRGAVAVVVRSPHDGQHAYRVRFPDGLEASLRRDEVILLAQLQEGEIGNASVTAASNDLRERVFYRCVIGSQAYGLSDEASDVDRRGIYLPKADWQWSLYGVPESWEIQQTQEAYWELQRFLVLALKANPNVLECLYTPMIERATPLAEELLSIRESFLSRLVYQTFNGYVVSQFKKLQADLRNHGQPKWKHVMHLIRLLLAGVSVLRTGELRVRVDEQRERLLAIKRGEVPLKEIDMWRQALHAEFDEAYRTTRLPERPDYARANAFLIAARRKALADALP